MTILFDSHKYANRLQDAGMPPALANIQAETTADLMNELNNLNDKLDKSALDASVKFERTNNKIEQVESKLNNRIDLVESRLEAKMADGRAELVRWVVGIGILQSSLIAALLLRMAP